MVTSTELNRWRHSAARQRRRLRRPLGTVRVSVTLLVPLHTGHFTVRPLLARNLDERDDEALQVAQRASKVIHHVLAGPR